MCTRTCQQVIRRHRQQSDGKNTSTVCLIVSCFDIRRVKLIFLLSSAGVLQPGDLPARTNSSEIFDFTVGQRVKRLANVMHHASSGSPTIGRKLLRITSEKLAGLGKAGGRSKQGVASIIKSSEEVGMFMCECVLRLVLYTHTHASI